MNNVWNLLQACGRAGVGQIARGRKTTHWMWFIFPQLIGLGTSELARRYAIGSLADARAYLAHPLLGKRIVECVEALQDFPGSDPVAVFGPVEALKLRSSLTMFAAADPERDLFAAALARWFRGTRDPRSLELLGAAGEGG